MGIKAIRRHAPIARRADAGVPDLARYPRRIPSNGWLQHKNRLVVIGFFQN
jgi:hypothetical protein